MDLAEFITRVRDHYVEQFEDFAADQARESAQGASEVKFRLQETSQLFGHVYCVDFLKGEADGGAQVVEFQPARILSFSEIQGSIGDAALTVEHLRWDDVVIRHDAPSLPPDMLLAWFERWFDPQDERHAVGGEISRVIHSMLVGPEMLSIDFGTAPPEAFVEILAILEQAGALSIRVTTSRAEADAEPEA
jgi:hypothetical protein